MRKNLNREYRIQIEREIHCEKRLSIERLFRENFLTIYVKYCSYIPFVYLAILIGASYYLTEIVCVIISLVLSVITGIIHHLHQIQKRK